MAALHVPGAGIVDYPGMARAMARRIEAHGHVLQTGAEVRDLDPAPHHVTVATTAGGVRARHVVNCAGLYADRIAEMSGQDPGVLIAPFRGEYYDFVPAPAGVRAQALRPDGTLVDDFLIKETDRVVNVINAASPAATASLNIGHHIVANYLSRRLATTPAQAA